MVALLVRCQAGPRTQPRFAGPPAAGIVRDSSITGPERSITGRYRDLSACGGGSGRHVARVSGLCPEIGTTTVPGVRPGPDAAGRSRESAVSSPVQVSG